MPDLRHSAKQRALPSAFRLTLGKANTNRNWAGRFALFCRVLLCFAECVLAHGKVLPSAKKKHSAKVASPSVCLSSVSCRVLHSAKRYTRQSLCRVYKSLCQVFLTLGKPPVSVVTCRVLSVASRRLPTTSPFRQREPKKASSLASDS